MKKSVFSDETIKEMVEYRQAGFTYKEISEIIGANPSTIRSWFFNHMSKEELEALRNATADKDSGKCGFNTKKKIHDIEEAISTLGEVDPKPTIVPVSSQEVIVKEKTLKDFQARDMIKHLYNMGYRIENNQLIVLQKVPVKINDIING